MRRALAVSVLAAVIATNVAAAAASRVLVVRPPDPDPTLIEAMTRLEAELRSAGFEVVSTSPAEGVDPRAEVEAVQPGPRPIATVALRSIERGAACDVWVADHLSDKTLVRRIDVRDADRSEAASTLAIRAVELLRASLLELEVPAPSAVPADVARWIQRPAAPAPAAWADPLTLPAIEGGAAVLGSFAGFGATFGPSLGVSHPAPFGTLVRGSLFVGLSHPVVRSGQDSATLSQELLDLDVVRPFAPLAGVLRPLVSIGVGAYHLRAEDGGYAASTMALAINAGAGLALQLGPRVTLDAALHALFLVPPPAIALAGGAAGRAGLPMLLGAVGVRSAL
jgi:hypothetical protein